jgi:hypothetical protein
LLNWGALMGRPAPHRAFSTSAYPPFLASLMTRLTL